MTTFQTIALMAFVGFMLYLSGQLPWREIVANKTRQHLIFGSAASLFVLWIFRAGIENGPDVHFLWLSALTLTLGFRWAIVAASMALLGVTAVGKESWDMLGINAWCGVIIPIATSYLIYMLSFHKIPRHLFVYIFVCGFFPGALLIALKMTLLGGYYFLDGPYTADAIVDNYLVLIPLLVFPEAMLNGMTMTLLIIYKPEWVYTFHDKFYLDKQ